MGTPYLVKRRAGWYIRIRTPADLRCALGAHVVQTLRTSALAAARGRALRVAAGMPGVWHKVRSEAVKILGRDIDELGHDDIIGCDRERLVADFEALGEQDRLRLKARLDYLMAEQIRSVEFEHEKTGLYRAAVDAMEHAKMVGKLEGMREAIAAGVGAAGPKAAPEDPLAEGSKLPVSRHLDAFFKDQAVSPKTEKEYRTTYRKMMDMHGDQPIGTISNRRPAQSNRQE